MIQDIYPHIYHNEYKDFQPENTDFILVFHRNTVMIRFKEEHLRYPTFSEMQSFSCDYQYLFSIDNYKYFLALPKSCHLEEPSIMIDGYHYENVRIFRSAASRHTAFT